MRGGDVVIRTFPPPAQPLAVRLLVAEDVCDFEYWASRLVHVELLRDAVAVAVYRIPLLAVPAGLNRRGGHLHMIEGRCAKQAVQALSGRPGFELLTRSGPLVSWGEPLPDDLSLEARRLFHGLREQPRNLTPLLPPAGHGGAQLGPGTLASLVRATAGTTAPSPDRRPGQRRTRLTATAPVHALCRASHPRYGTAPKHPISTIRPAAEPTPTGALTP
ncbi:DUF6302 family protein [Streptomyces viridosporus]|uniref:DUF6302 family protein n=1 Tax=Streptomyces viridosporus TaxID=67581 RepID=UPI00332D7CBE